MKGEKLLKKTETSVKRNTKKMVIGLVFIIVALGCAGAAFYFLEIKPELASREHAGDIDSVSQKEKVKEEIKLIEEVKVEKNIKIKRNIEVRIKEKVLAVKKWQKKIKQDVSVELKSSGKAEQKDFYGKAERARREGLLWVDQKSSKFVITLGAVQGLVSGKQLIVYDGKKKIGQVVVETAFDVISYVDPVKESEDIFIKNYYQVVVK